MSGDVHVPFCERLRVRLPWSTHLTYLPSRVSGQWFYLYLILDLYSRKVVGWEVHAEDDSQHATRLVQRTALAEGIGHAHHPRPRVSDDNAFVESLFRTAKYRPGFPHKGFDTLQAARSWAADFVHWYNMEHRHSGIQYVTPHQRHEGLDKDILAKRDELYRRAQLDNPRRWSGDTRNWEHIDVVTLNPERDEVVNMDMQNNREKTRAAA